MTRIDRRRREFLKRASTSASVGFAAKVASFFGVLGASSKAAAWKPGLANWFGYGCAGPTLNLSNPGTLYTGGQGTEGQLGLGAGVTSVSTPTKVGTAANWWDVCQSGYVDNKNYGGHTLALRADGTLWAWGKNGYGQLGTGDTTGVSAPVQVLACSRWKAIGVGSHNDSQASQGSSFAIKHDGSLWSWGSNDNVTYLLGTPTQTASRSSPIQVGTDKSWVKVRATFGLAVARKQDGTLWNWGFIPGASVTYSSPVQLGAATTWTNFALGHGHIIGIRSDGTIWTMGNNGQGQLGQGDTTARGTMTQVGSATDWADVSAGTGSCYARKTNGTIWSWGLNNFGNLGHFDQTNRSVPAQIGAGTTWAEITGCGNGTLARKTDGTLWGWGNIMSTQTSSPVQIGAGTDWKRIGDTRNMIAMIRGS